MDEVDRIIILSLKSVGCEIDDDLSSLAAFDADLIYQAVLSCVEAIKMKASDLPRRLPPGMSQKFRAGSLLATSVTELGYKGEVGYQTFLYSNEADIRKVLMFLADKLPRDSSGAADEQSTAAGSGHLRASIQSKIQAELKKTWLPPECCRGQHSSQPFRGHPLLTASLLGDNSKKLTKDMMRYYEMYLPDVSKQAPNSAALCSALIENNALQLLNDEEVQWRLHSSKPTKNKVERTEEIFNQLVAEREEQIKKEVEKTLTDVPESRFTQLERLQHTTKGDNSTPAESGAGKSKEKADPGEAAATEEEILAKQEEEVESLKQELQEVTNRIAKLTRNIDKAKTAREQTAGEVEVKKKAVEESKKSYQVKKKTLDVLPESEKTIARVEQVIAGADSKMKSLEAQWLDHKTPLVRQIEELQTQAKSRQANIERKLTELQEFKSQMKSCSEDAKVKDEQLKALTAEYEGMSRDVSRSSYTKRIIEIVGNIKKQKRDIEEVLVDTRAVQKEINLLTGKLDRIFTITDELIFKDAKRDEGVRAAYKYLASLHDNCTSVRSTIEETGHILREIRQLEDQIAQESRNEVSSTLDKIIDDYKQMRKENQQLMAKLKQ